MLQGHNGYTISVRFAHTSYLLATASSDGSTRLWDAASGEHLATTTGKALGFALDDRRLAFRASGSIGLWDVASGDECRTLHPAMLGNRSERRDALPVLAAEFSPDGRLLATGDRDGVRLWEANSGREVAHLKDRDCGSVLFHPDGQSLIAAGARGLYRWPISPDPEQGADALRIGPPELLRESIGHEWNKAAWLPDHRTLAMIDNPRAQVVLVDSSQPHPARSPAAVMDSGRNRRMTTVAVSPDGRWLAVGGWQAGGVQVWDLPRRRLERFVKPNDPVSEITTVVGFSPDSQWLLSRTNSTWAQRLQFWRTGTWETGHRADVNCRGGAFQAPVFTADGQLMAIGVGADQVLLADATTGRELVRLTTLRPIDPMPLAFSPDGTKLATGTSQKTALVWDLRRIRDQLASRGLDWDALPYPASNAAGAVASAFPPLRRVRVVGEIVETKLTPAAPRLKPCWPAPAGTSLPMCSRLVSRMRRRIGLNSPAGFPIGVF